MYGVNLVTIDVPLPDFTRYKYEGLRVDGRELNTCYIVLSLYDMITLLCLDIPQTNCLV